MRKKLSSEGIITAERLAKLLGVEIDGLKEIKRFIGKPDKAGNYPMEAALCGAMEVLKEQRDFMAAPELAEMFGLSGGRISILTSNGVFEQSPGRGWKSPKYARAENMRRGIQWLHQRMGEGKTTAGQLKIEAQKLENETRKLNLEMLMKKVLPVSAVERAWAHIVLTAREKALRIGNIIGPRMALFKSPQEAETEINRLVEEFLGELAKQPDYEEAEQGEAI